MRRRPRNVVAVVVVALAVVAGAGCAVTIEERPDGRACPDACSGGKACSDGPVCPNGKCPDRGCADAACKDACTGCADAGACKDITCPQCPDQGVCPDGASCAKAKAPLHAPRGQLRVATIQAHAIKRGVKIAGTGEVPKIPGLHALASIMKQ